jgi:hypothetical protein
MKESFDYSEAYDRINSLEEELKKIDDYDTQSAKQKAINIDLKQEIKSALTFQRRAVVLHDRIDALERAGFTHDEAFAIIMMLIKENKGIN